MSENQKSQEEKTGAPMQPEYLPSGIRVYAELVAKHFRIAEPGEVAEQERSPEELLLRWSSEPPSRADVDELVLNLRTLGMEPVMETIGTDLKLFYKLCSRQ